MPGYSSFKLNAVSFMRPDYVPVDSSQAEYDKKVIQPGLVSHDDFEITETPITSGVQEGQKVTVKKKKIGKITIFDLSALARLKEWEEQNIPIYVYGAGNEFLLWEKPSHFNISRSLKSKDGLQGFDVEIETNETLLNPQIKWGKNLLFLKNGAWQDANADELADGYSSVGVITNSDFNNDSQLITGNAGSIALQYSFIFPIKDIKLYLSLDWQLLSPNSNDQRISLLNYNDELITNSSLVVNQTGRKNLAINSVGLQYKVLIQILRINSLANEQSSSGRFPVLSSVIVNDKAEY